MTRTRLLIGMLAAAVLTAACAPIAAVDDAGAETLIATSGAPALPVALVATTTLPITSPSTTVPPTTTTAVATTAVATTAVATTEPPTTLLPTTTRPQIPRVVHEQEYKVFAVAEGMAVRLPSASVERVGFHESNHDGARQMEPLDLDVRIMTMETRNRDTGSRTAADIVVQPDTEIRAPVTGTVVRAGHYILYCDHDDNYAVIEPDEKPGWEVKILHIRDVQVATGDRVEAGVTLIAPRARPLPFDSQVDEFTAEPSWPHVHVEIVDPSIPDRPSTGSC